MNKITRFLIIGLLLTPALLIAQAPVAHFSASDTAICDSSLTVNFTDLSTNTPTSWKWYFPGATPNASTLKDPTNIRYKGYGCYTVKLVVKNSHGSDSLTDSNYICLDSPPHVVFTGPDALCYGSSATITAYGGTQYLWNTGATTSSINIIGTVSFTYSVKVTSGACYKDTSFTIAVGDEPPGYWRFAGDTSICVGDTTTISAFPQNNSYSYLWSTGATTDSITVTSATPGFYTYTLTVGNVGCTNSGHITVGVHVCTQGVENYNDLSGEVEVYPNPSNGVFIFQTNNQQPTVNSYIEIYNTLGQQVYQSAINAVSTEINLSRQPQGVYLYRVITETGELIGEGKVVVQK